MAAPQGNRFWEARATHGKDKIFTSPQLLKDACIQYFEWVEDHPLWEYKVAQFQGAPVEMPVNKMRAMTVESLCLFLDIAYCTWRTYATHESHKDYVEVIAWAESVIRSQKFAGAAADLFNANIIARDLGLVDKKETQTNITFDNLSDDELEAKIQSLTR
jgi:hypothetical protein